MPYNLVATYELDSHIPLPYVELGHFFDQFDNSGTDSFEDLVRQQQDKLPEVIFAISNCQTAIRPDRLRLMEQLDRYLPSRSYGACLKQKEHYDWSWNSRSTFDSRQFIEERGRYLFFFVPENAYGIDYVSEVCRVATDALHGRILGALLTWPSLLPQKIFLALRSGSIPIYQGAPNVAAYIPDRNAIIHVKDVASVKELREYLNLLAANRTLLAERHLLWRTRPLPERLGRMVKLIDNWSDYPFMCRVCHCFHERIGCPNVTAALEDPFSLTLNGRRRSAPSEPPFDSFRRETNCTFAVAF